MGILKYLKRNNMRIYLDVCCYGRPYDIHTQPQIAAEAVAVKAAIDKCLARGDVIVGGFMLEEEIDDISKPDKWEQVRGFYDNTINERVLPNANISIRARSLQTQGLRRGDSYHLACAEAALVDFLLTTDSRFINACKKLNFSFVKVINPINF
jgi:predicted nucleic acid-binding protein